MDTSIKKVICKKPLRQGGDNIYVDFKKGVEYYKFDLETEIIKHDDDDFEINNSKYKYIFIYDTYGGNHGGFRFSLNKNEIPTSTIHFDAQTGSSKHFINFYDYFYDQKELRKLKLEKINENIRN